MKIAINTLALGKVKVGMGNYIVSFIHSLTNIDTENDYVIYVSALNKHYFSDIGQKNILLVDAPLFATTDIGKIVWEQFFLPVDLFRKKVDIFHNPGFTLPLLASPSCLVTVADMTFYTHPFYHTRKKLVYFQTMMRLAFIKASGILTISENTKKDVLRFLTNKEKKEKPVSVTLLAPNHKIHQIPKKDAHIFLQETYGVQTSFILFVGMLEPRKNIDGLVHAYAALKRKCPQLSEKLILIGKKGWMYSSLSEIIKKKGLEKDVLFIGYVPDDHLSYFYSAASVFVYPSFYEGFGIPILEAMKCGCPVITSNNSSLAEIGASACSFVDPKQVLQLSLAMENILMNDTYKNKLLTLGKKQVQKFSWDSCARQTLAAYQHIFNMRKGEK